MPPCSPPFCQPSFVIYSPGIHPLPLIGRGFPTRSRMSFLCLLRRRLLHSKISLYSRSNLRSYWYRQPDDSPGIHCEVDAEPLGLYRKGGYHPTHLGDPFKNGRYKIVHKLGWTDYATVWLAKDLMLV